MRLLLSCRRWLRRAFRRVGFRRVRFNYFETDLRDREFHVPAGIEVAVRRVPPDEIRQRLEELGEFGFRGGERGAAAGDRCYFAEVEGQLAGYSWISTQGIRNGRHLLSPVAPKGVYSYLSFVFPDYRGNKLFQRMLCHIYRELQDEGYEFACNLVSRQNVRSIRSRQRFDAVGKPISLLFLPGTKPWVLGGPIGTGESTKQHG